MRSKSIITWVGRYAKTDIKLRIYQYFQSSFNSSAAEHPTHNQRIAGSKTPLSTRILSKKWNFHFISVRTIRTSKVVIIVPPWWHTCVQWENANEDELFMPREELSLSAIVEKKEWCLIERSEIRQSFWTEIKERESFPRQGKCPSGQFGLAY